jgi:hypothetical protein
VRVHSPSGQALTVRRLDPRRPMRTLLGTALLAIAALGLLPAPAIAADGFTMEAKALLDGHARVGSWMAISVHMKNDGPAVTGELRMTGGAQGRTRFGQVVDLPTQSDKTFLLYAQPPSFGRELEVAFVNGDQTIAKTKVAFTIHDGTQLIVGVVAERPGDIVGGIDLLPNQNQLAPVIVSFDPEDLPERVEAWGGLDRLVWQDLDSNRLTPGQLEALRGWVAGGGRLVIVGGTAGPNSLAAFPDALLPYRPTATVNVAASSLTSLVGNVPAGTVDLPALGGELTDGRALVTSGDRVIAAERGYGNGAVTLIGFDPSTKWIADGSAGETLWRRLLPARSYTGLVLGDDSQLVSAVSQLPSLALPPIGGLIGLLGAYILLVGPINYLVLRRLDRRDWAWITMPALIGVFAVGAYGFGAVLRGSEVLVNEVALVRGSPGATDGTAQVYIGVFSPSRGTYQVNVPGGALLSAPISGDFFGGDGSASSLDVLQGDPAKVRDLAVGYGSLRTVRAETAVAVPLIQTDLRLIDGRLQGTVKNASTVTLQKPAVVLGGTVTVLKDLDPGAEAKVDVAVAPVPLGEPLSDKVVGTLFFGDSGQFTADMTDQYIRHTIIDQLTYDPNFGSTGSLSTDGAVVLAWGSGSLLPVDIVGQKPRATGNILYYLPTSVAVSGKTTFRGDLLRSSTIDASAAFFSKDPFSINFGKGSATVAYRPISFTGTFAPTELAMGLNFGGDMPIVAPVKTLEPLPSIPTPCADPPTPDCAVAGLDGLPEVELFDLATGDWVRLPHMAGGSRYAIAEPTRYIDPTSGSVVIRFVNDRSDGVGFSFDLSMTGSVR